MPAIEPRPDRILAVLLGAGWYAQAPKLAQGTSFENSARDLREYLTRPNGLGLPRANINWLFDDTRSAVDQLRDFGEWLDRRQQQLKAAATPAADLILYYVGHGMFCGPQRAYHLAIRATEESYEGLTSISVSQLAQTLNDRARFLRKFLVLDCCFAGAAYHEFLSGPLQASWTQLVNEMPSRGTALLCAASAQEAAIAPRGLPRTMFSDSLLKSLEGGHPGLATRMSLSDVGALVRLKLKESFPDNWVRPEIHCPDQREGEIAAVGLFPNPAVVQLADSEEDARRKAEEDKKKAQRNRGAQEGQARLAKDKEVLERIQKAAQEQEAEAIRKAEKQRQAGIRLAAWAVTAAGIAIVAAFVGVKLFTGSYQAPSEGPGSSIQLQAQPQRPAVSGDTVPPASTANQSAKDCDVCPEMVKIPAGQFTMGSPDEEKGRYNNESPQHQVRLKAFSIGKFDVTFDEWDACMTDHWCEKNPNARGWGRGKRPVINVSWNDAQEYVRWLSQKTHRQYRLPSESQWEYAARARTTTPYYWGETMERGYATCNGCGNIWDNERAGPVGRFDANPWGLFDMAGNVWQWTEDCYHDNYEKAPPDGSAWDDGDCPRRVARGGSWFDEPRGLRSADRNGVGTGYSGDDLGFRVAKD